MSEYFCPLIKDNCHDDCMFKLPYDSCEIVVIADSLRLMANPDILSTLPELLSKMRDAISAK